MARDDGCNEQEGRWKDICEQEGGKEGINDKKKRTMEGAKRSIHVSGRKGERRGRGGSFAGLAANDTQKHSGRQRVKHPDSGLEVTDRYIEDT